MTDHLYRVDPTLPEDEAEAWAPHLEERGWARTTSDDWRFWLAGGYPSEEFYAALRPDQWVSRIPGISALAVKRDLCLNARWARRWAGAEEPYRDHPIGYLLPDERDEAIAALAADDHRRWLLKPQASRWGQGISLLGKLDDLPETGDWLVQEYIARPHLIDGLKYHLRFYVLITSLEPLVLYVHDLGSCLFATRPFSLDPTRTGDRFVHITNVAIQERGERPQRKWLMAAYLERLRTEGIDDDRLLRCVHDALIRLVVAGREQALIESRNHGAGLETCFDLLSVDVAIDADLRPWVLEFNAGAPMTFPAWKKSGAAATGQDAECLQRGLMGDLLDLLGFGAELPQRRTGELRASYWLQRDRAERSRSAGWRRLWPTENAARFVDRFPLLRPGDRALVSRFSPQIPADEMVFETSPQVTSLSFDDVLVLHHDGSKRLHLLDATGAVIWLSLREGLAVEQILDDLAEVFASVPRHALEFDLWGLLTVLAQEGLLIVDTVDARIPVLSELSRRLGSQVPNLVVSARAVGDTLFVAMDERVVERACELPDGSRYEPRELPETGIRRLVLVESSDLDQPTMEAVSRHAVLDRLLSAAEASWTPSVQDTRDLLHWLEGLCCLEVATTWSQQPTPPWPWAASVGASAGSGPSAVAPRPALAAKSHGTVRLAAVGDVVLGRDLTKRLELHGHRYPFERIADLLAPFDVRCCNLESPLTLRGVARSKAVTFRGRPEHAAALRHGGFEVVSLANNHIADFGDEGVLDTLRALSVMAVQAVGARPDATRPFEAVRLEREGLGLRFLAYNDFVEGTEEEHRLVALADEETLRREVELAVSTGDLVVVSLHAGPEYRIRPGERQRHLACAAVDAGAALVIGHHPHVLQGLERRGAGLIAHSLGNCVFDLRHNPLQVTESGFVSVVLEVLLTRDGVVGAHLHPIVIDLTEDRPRSATATEAQRILERMRCLSNCAIAPSGRVLWSRHE